MTRTTLRRILVVVALLGVGYGAVVLSTGPEDSGETEGPVAEILRRAAGSELDSVRIEGEDRTVVLRNRGDAWRVDGHRADSARVAELRAALEGGASVGLASRNAENHARMGVDSAGATRLLLASSGAGTLRLLVGDDGPLPSSVYARAPGTTPVYLVPGGLGRLVGRDAEGWRDRTVAAVDTGRAGVIRVRRGDTTYRLRRSDSGWRLDGGAVDSARVERVLADLSGLEARGFAPDTASVEAGDRTVTVLGSADGDTLADLRMRRTGPRGAPRFLVRARGRGGILELTPAQADRLAPPVAELRPGRRGGDRGTAAPGPGTEGEAGGAGSGGG